MKQKNKFNHCRNCVYIATKGFDAPCCECLEDPMYTAYVPKNKPIESKVKK